MKTLRTFKWKLVVFLSAAAGAVFLVLQCANPLDQPPFKWRSKIEVPMTNDSFHIAQKLPEMISSFNDSAVRFWSRTDSLPWYQPGQRSVDPKRNFAEKGAKYFSTTTVTYPYASITWQKDRVYEWTGTAWKDKGEMIDILLGGYDSASLNGGIEYNDSIGPGELFYEYEKGDSIIMSIPRTDTASYLVSQDSMKTKYFHPSLGPVTIGSLNSIMQDSLRKKDTLPLVSNSIDTTFKLWLRGIQLVAINPISPPCTVTVRNLSTTATVYNCTLTVFDSVRSFGTLGPGTSATQTFPVVFNTGGGSMGIAFSDTLNIRVRQDSASSVSPGDRMAIMVDLNGLIASEVTAYSHYIRFAKSFINPYVLTDTLDINYIDVDNGHFVYGVNNYVDVPIQIIVSQYHLWVRNFCAFHTPTPLERVGDLTVTTYADTQSSYDGYQTGYMQADRNTISTDSSDNIHGGHRINISADRLFPVYRHLALGEASDTGWQSTAPVEYLVTEYPEQPERMSNVKMTDTLTFTIKAPGFKFKQMLATVAIAYHREGDTAKIQVPFPFNKESKDSLKGKLILQQVIADIFLTTGLPSGAYINTLQVGDTLFDPLSPSTSVNASSTFNNVSNNKTFRQPTDITQIVNQWPDSIYVTEAITVPVGTKVLAVNETPKTYDDSILYNRYMGRMNIRALTTVRTNILLGWEVLDTAKLDLGVGTFKISKDMKYFDRMEDVKASLTMRMLNRTNLYMRLYTLVAPAPRIRLLENMSFDSVLILARDSGLAHQRGYMCLLGQKGISIPARSTRDTSFIELKQWQIDSMFKYDSCAWRWEANFLPMAADTLRDTDLIYIQSWVHMEGINNMDSLLIWK